ncbi:DUF3263 domain-containing protein [Glutamicibacter nicotianae]|uniref:DUF3263 domain-containing protein n=1 Tax=Glutamicibacter nicotianae TaxID=37929 RepID=UPI000EF92AC9|nr:DUF3263 domain-containing protein [Glutamicibacter nicotianae]
MDNEEQQLDELSQRILDFETQHWKYAGAKEAAISEQLDLQPAHYYQLLNRLIESDRALAHNPMLIKQLRSKRSTRRRL